MDVILRVSSGNLDEVMNLIELKKDNILSLFFRDGETQWNEIIYSTKGDKWFGRIFIFNTEEELNFFKKTNSDIYED